VLEFSKRDVLLVGCANGLVGFVPRDDAVKWKLEGDLTCGCWIDDARAVVRCANLVVSIQIAKDPVTVLTAHGDVTDVVMQQLNGLWAVADLAGTVSVFERAGNTHKAVQLHRPGVSAITWSEVSNVYTTGGLDGLVKIVAEGPPVTSDGGHQSAVYALAFDSVGRYLASADVDTVNIWKIPENKLAISYRLVQCPVVRMMWKIFDRHPPVGTGRTHRLRADLLMRRTNKHHNRIPNSSRTQCWSAGSIESRNVSKMK
jgi:WD40 repeat protein